MIFVQAMEQNIRARDFSPPNETRPVRLSKGGGVLTLHAGHAIPEKDAWGGEGGGQTFFPFLTIILVNFPDTRRGIHVHHQPL